LPLNEGVNILYKVSATSIQEYALCARKFWITHNTPKDQRPPPTEAQRFGIRLHEAEETWLKEGKLPEVSESDPESFKIRALVELAIPFLPPPNTAGSAVEQWIEMPTYAGGPRFVGKVDLMDSRTEIIEVTDHKTFKKSSKNHTYLGRGQELQDSIQMASYGRYVLTDARFSGKDRSKVKIRHVYFRVDGDPFVDQAVGEITKEKAEETWQSTLNLIRGMSDTAKATRFEDVTPNVYSCEAFGGCPYQSKCGFETEISRQLYQVRTNSMAKTGLLSRAKNPIVPPDAPSRESSTEEVIAAEAETRKVPEDQVREEIANDLPKDEEIPYTVEEKYTPGDMPSFEVYVDCIDLLGSEKAVPYEFFVNPIATRVAKENGVADIAFLTYGEGKAKLRVAIREELWRCPRVVLVSSMTLYADAFIDAVYPYAGKMVRSLRG
jgi:hypothetical protein